jgi:hypothetical protein
MKLSRDIFIYINLKMQHCINLKLQQLCDICFKIYVGTRVTYEIGSYIFYV